MYVAVNKQDESIVRNFTWTEEDELIIDDQVVSPDDWEIVEIYCC